MLGEAAPYFSDVTGSGSLEDDSIYWEEWQHHLPKFQLVDVDSSNHMVMLSESESLKVISNLCDKLYSEEGIPGII